MEKSIGHGSMGSNMFTETEWEVARSLLQLSRMRFTWGCRKRRSAKVPHYLSSSPMALHHGDAVKVVKRNTSILATSLFFESKEKPNSLRIKISCKRKREDYLNTIEDLTKTKDTLNQEINTVKHYYDQLKIFNLKLKARKEELSNGPKSEYKNPNLQLVHANASAIALQPSYPIKKGQNPQNPGKDNPFCVKALRTRCEYSDPTESGYEK